MLYHNLIITQLWIFPPATCDLDASTAALRNGYLWTTDNEQKPIVRRFSIGPDGAHASKYDPAGFPHF